MRAAIFALGLALAACAGPGGAPTTTATLISAGAATNLAVGERLFLERSAQEGAQGADPVVNIALRHEDGRRMAFQEANHTPHDLFVQRPGGALAQVMALSDAQPTLYHAAGGGNGRGAPFFCGPSGPAAIGVHEGADGAVRIVGLQQPFQVETLSNGELNAVPYSPDQVCARLSFRRG